MRLFEGTEFDRPPQCERCGQLEIDCNCPPIPSPVIPPGRQTARLAVEKRKKGKVVTVIRGLAPDGNDLPAILTQLKNVCGTGGTLKDDTLELQGDQADRARAALVAIGFKVR